MIWIPCREAGADVRTCAVSLQCSIFLQKPGFLNALLTVKIANMEYSRSGDRIAGTARTGEGKHDRNETRPHIQAVWGSRGMAHAGPGPLRDHCLAQRVAQLEYTTAPAYGPLPDPVPEHRPGGRAARRSPARYGPGPHHRNPAE